MENPRVFACYTKNKKILKKSSSGGVFYTLASHYIKKLKGVVYGATIVNGDVYHTKATTIEELMPLLGSKYVRSNLKNTFKECQNDLEEGKHVLYCGTPCQINALHFFLNKYNVNKDKLLSVDTICHGTPKRCYWEKYLELNFKNKDISYINFRYKKQGWEKYYIKVGEYESPFSQDPYMINFLNNRILEESCFNCQCKGENRKADITLEDFWGINNIDHRFKNKMGTSLFVIRNKTDELLNIISKESIINEVPYLDTLFENNCTYFQSVSRNNDVINEESLTINHLPNKNSKLLELMRGFKYWLLNKINALLVGETSVYKNKNNRSHNNKIGILTLFGYINYGNKLQNYALTQLVKKNGKKPFNIYYLDKIHHVVFKLSRGYIFRPYTTKKEIIKASKKYEKNLYFRKTTFAQKKLCNLETIIVGSDQVWNPSHRLYKNDLDYFLGNFGIINHPFKLISYASSICINEFTQAQKTMFKYSLINFDKISVREDSSLAPLKDIGINAITVLDPVLLLSKDEWEKAIRKYSKIDISNKKYDLCYILEDDGINKISQNNMINIAKENINQFDFINYIKNAEIVVTNSFHCLAFCIIFKKRVLVKERLNSGMDNRIKELFKLIDLPITYGKILDLEMIDTTTLEKAKEESLLYLQTNI